MILTWLWKLYLAFRRSREPARLQAPAVPGDVINRSGDANNAGVVIFDGDAPIKAIARD